MRPKMLRKQSEPTDSPIDRACFKESYLWLISNQPDLAEALEQEMEMDATPYELYRKVLYLTSRPELAKRILLAATYLHQGDG